MRSEQELNRAIEQYSNTVRRLCMIHLKNYYDTEDIFQTVFLKYVLNSVEFENDEHEKAWFIRVTINACKYLIKSFFRSKTVPLDEILTYSENISNDKKEVLEAVLSLPLKYKNVVYLHLIESLSNSNDIEFGNGQGNGQCNERGNGQGNGQCNERGNGQGNGQCNGQGKMQCKNFNN